MGAALLQPIGTQAAVASPEQVVSVPPEEYALYDLVVEAKFLTSRTRSVVLERMTTTQLHPDHLSAPTVAWCNEQSWFDGRLPQDLIRDFVAKNQHPSRLEAHFTLGVRYRFVSGEGVPETEAGLFAIPVGRPVQELEGELDTIDRLAFSRVGMTLRGDQALLNVANPRRDGTGAGFLFWLLRRQGRWDLYDTEVLWVAQIDGSPPRRPSR
ncbi:MAG: hypothetical protein K0S58_311 [Nitrospira sp.]|jgi:hypothetical protein|nr:hypothetical protein [Nitrospira sp.]